jgi:predicted transposase/invertase (TIGR01784 family)
LVEQLKSGFDYGKLTETVCVVICDHVLIPEEKDFLNIYGLRNAKSENLFTKLLKLYIIELPKLPRDDDGSPSWPWLQFFKCREEGEFDMLAKKHPEVRPIIAEYKKLTWSERRRMIADLKEKYRRDDAAVLEDALMDKSREIARKMKARGRPLIEIVEDTGLSQEEIETL